MSNKNKPTNLLDILEMGRPQDIAIENTNGQQYTYASLQYSVESIGKQLRRMGIRREDKVAIAIPNSLHTIIAFLGVSCYAIAAPMNPSYKTEEFRFFLEDTDAKAIITDKQGNKAILEAALEGTTHISIDSDIDGNIKLSSNSSGVYSYPDDAPNADHVALVLHTSGTTSRPKMVPLTHGNLASSITNIIDTYKLQPDDKSLCVMPLFHVHGLVASTLSTLGSGGTVLVPNGFNPFNFLRISESHPFTWYTSVPSIHNSILSRAKGNSSAYKLPSLRFIRSCSSALSPTTMSDLEDLFDIPVLEAYGMTEASHQMSSNPMPPATRLAGSVGKATGIQISIMDEKGNIKAPQNRGEVVIKGPNIFHGYEHNPEANTSSFTDGWFRTGDEGMLDVDGYLTLLGRLKEIINRSGEKISPQEIDEILLSHPSVAEAVAFGIPHSIHGEEPSAAVVLKNSVSQSELIRFCREYLADFKCPRVIHIVDQIPRTATGKIQRRLVAETVNK